MKLVKFALTPPIVAISVALCAALSSFGGEPPADTYTKIDFLESTGKQYIKTGVKADPTTVATVDFQYTDLTTQQRLLGADKNAGMNLAYSILIGSDGKFASSLQDGAGDTLSSDVTADTVRHTAVLNAADGTFSLDGAVVSTHAAAVTKTANREMFLFATDNSGAVQNQSKVRIYSVRIEQGGATVRDFVPCYVKTTLQLGLYDRQNDVFYPNGNTSTTDPVFVAPLQVVYVKPTACGTEDGSSWANALGSVSNALVVALKRPAPREVHMAKGIHMWLSGLWIGRDIKGELDPQISGGYAFAIRGGYAGVSEDETADNEANPTYLNFDVNGDDRWVKRDLNAAFYNGQNVTTDLGKVVGDDGEVVWPEEVGDTEMVHVDSTKVSDNSVFLNLQDNGTGNLVQLSDFTVLGAGNANSYVSPVKGKVTGSFIIGTSAAVTYKNMTFLGGYFPNPLQSVSAPVGTAAGGKITSLADIMTNVKFLHIYAGSRFLAHSANYGAYRNITMREIYFPTATSSGTAFYFRSGTGCLLENCLFEKCYATSSSGTFGPSTITGMEQGQGHLYTNCVYRNNWAKGPNMTSALNFRTTSANGAIQMRVVDCLFESNKTYTTANSGKIYNLGTVELGMNDNVLLGCTFRDNLSVVKPTGACSSSHASTVTISSIPSKATTTDPRRAVVNCTFCGNRVELDTGSVAAEEVFSRSILVDSIFGDNPLDVVIANCTFADASSVLPDVRWTGVDTTYPVSVINSFFLGDAANGYVPFISDAQGMLEVDNCLMNGCDTLPTGVAGDDNVFMELPVGAWDDLSGARAAAVIRPAANVPALRTALPLNGTIVNEGGNATTIRSAFYPLDTDGTALYRTTTAAIPSVEPLDDAVGDVRPADAATIGAVQALTEKAENGATLYVDVNPKGAGTLSGGGTIQVVDKGEGIVEITATSSDPARYTFEGWKLPDGTVYSDAATLTISKLDDNLQLTASFSAPKVTYTFDLGAAGTFDESGESKAVLELSPGDKLTVPAFTIDEEKVVPYGWDVPPPATVGTENQTFTYQYLEKLYRIIRVDASAADGGDGSTWANAMNDIKAAIELAGVWQGEVWIRQGVHLIGKTTASYLTMKKNVQILGGFEGADGKYDDVEAERAARDPEAFRSVLTGDLNLDDVWRSTELGYDADMRDETNGVFTVVGADGKFRMPEFKSGRICYGHGAKTANIGTIFDNTEASIDETAVLDGVTLTGAERGIDNGQGAHPLVRNCTFMGAAKFLSKTYVTCQNCRFVAVGLGQTALDETTVVRSCEGTKDGAHTVLDNCTFRYCYGASRGIFVFTDQQGYYELKDCLFEQCSGSVGISIYCAQLLGCEHGNGLVSGVTFRNCWSDTGAWIAAFSNGGAIVTNCLFEGCSVAQNAAKNQTANTSDCPCLLAGSTSPTASLKMYNCTFRDNTVDRTVGNHVNSKNAQAAVAYAKGSSGSAFVNCTFANNTVTCESFSSDYPAKASVLLVRDIVGQQLAKAGVANCTFVNNAAADGDIYLADRTGTTPFYLVNTICWGGEGHQAVTASGAGNAELYAWNSIVHGLDAGASFVADVTACATTSPGAMRKWTTSELMPHFAKAVGGSSAAVKGGRNVYADANNVICVPTDAGETAFVNLATGAAVKPSGAKALLPDVFGNARTAGEVTMGALEGRYADGMAILVR